jgi:hypothetical protein
MRLPCVQKNPVTMVGTLERCWLFTFRTPAEAVCEYLPGPLQPVTWGDVTYWNVVVAHIARMRPKPAPAISGVSYWHVAYRLYVRFTPPGGAPLEGLYFVRSDCDSRLMTAAGNLLTDFNFHTAQVAVERVGDELVLRVASADAPAAARLTRDAPTLPDGAPFASLDEAARALKYQPYGISADRQCAVNVVRISRDERAWQSRLRHVAGQEWRFLAGKPVQPELCYEVAPIDYQWNRARVYRMA